MDYDQKLDELHQRGAEIKEKNLNIKNYIKKLEEQMIILDEQMRVLDEQMTQVILTMDNFDLDINLKQKRKRIIHSLLAHDHTELILKN